MRKDFLVYGKPSIHQAEIDSVVEVMESGWLGTGPRVDQFEQEFAHYKGVPSSQVAALNSCTAALHTSLVALNLEPGDEVITTALTFCATVNAIIHAGATPVLADIDPLTMNIDVQDLKRRITERTRAILPVHFAGRPCLMDEIMNLAERHNLMVVEDCAHAIETEYHGAKAGTIGHFGCFSFYVTKNVITGEGGMAIAREPEAIDRIKILSLHGMSKDAWKRYSDDGYKHYKVVECGFKYNMTDLQAAIGTNQLNRVEQNWRRRRDIWNSYQAAFKTLPVKTPAKPEPGTRHSYHLYTLQIEPDVCGVTRDEFMNALRRRNIGVGVHYTCLADHPFYQHEFGWDSADYPNARKTGETTVSLPLSAGLSDADVTDVIDTVCEVIHKAIQARYKLVNGI